jgi:hypothetical protein
MNSQNLKATWKLIGMIINRKKTSSQTITKLLYKNKSYTDKANIAHQLNTHYINIGHDLAEKLPKSPINPIEITLIKLFKIASGFALFIHMKYMMLLWD